MNLQHSSLATHLLGELVEEELGPRLNLFIVVHDTRGQLADLTFDLDHVVEDEVGEYHQRVLTYEGHWVPQSVKKNMCRRLLGGRKGLRNWVSGLLGQLKKGAGQSDFKGY